MDFSSILGAVDWSGAAVAQIAIAALVAVPTVIREGSRMVLRAISPESFADNDLQDRPGYDEAAWDAAEDEYLYGSGSGDENPAGQRG